MKRFVFFGIVVTVLVGSLLITSQAQPWRGWKGSGGWGCKSNYQRNYNPQKVVTVKGKVLKVEEITPASGMAYGIHLLFKTEAETLSVHLGPVWFVERQDFEVNKNDELEIKGSKITLDNSKVLIASEVKKGEDELILRDENGFPLWSGFGRRGRLFK
ncbi:DNA-binding protein [bacterium]|nr:DNA-binding protein [bacterium]